MHVGGGWTCWGRALDAKGGGVWLSLVLASPSLSLPHFCFLLATHSPTQQVLWTARCGSRGQPWANQNPLLGTSLAVQLLRLHAPTAGDPGSIPGQGTRSHMPPLKTLPAATTQILHASTNIPCARTKTWCSQILKKRKIPSPRVHVLFGRLAKPPLSLPPGWPSNPASASLHIPSCPMERTGCGIRMLRCPELVEGLT